MIKYIFVGVSCLLLGSLLFIPGNSDSQCYNNQVRIQSSYSYVQPVASYPVYQNNYQYAQSIAVPVIVPAAMFQYLPAYNNSLQHVRQANKNVDTEFDINKENLEQFIRQVIKSEISNSIVNNGPPQLVLNGNKTNEVSDESITQQVANLLAGRGCIECHTEGKKVSGDVSLFKKDGDNYLFQPNTSPRNIYNAVKYNIGGTPNMPPASAVTNNTASRLTEEEVEIINRWSSN